MHKKLIEHANESQLKDIACKVLEYIKEHNKNDYKAIELEIYTDMYGYHFTDWLLEKALSKMVNEDGTYGYHYKIEDTNDSAKNQGITFNDFNKYDWNYVVNMMYSDYYGIVSNDINTYSKLAKKFLLDKDGKKGKALIYYLSMKD